MKKIINLLRQKDSDDAFMAKKSFWALFHKSAGMISQYLLIFLIARLYGATAQGSFTLSFTLIQLFAILTQLGLDNRLVRKIASDRRENSNEGLSRDYSQSLMITIISAVIWALLIYNTAPYIAEIIFKKPQLLSSIQFVGIGIIPFVFIGLNSSAFRGMKNMAGFLLFRAASTLVGALILLIFYFNNSSLPVFASYTLATILICLVSFYLWVRSSKIAISWNFKNIPLKKILLESVPLMLTGSVFFILGWTDNIMIGILRTEAEVGIYDIAFKISSLAAIVLLSINAIQAPIFAELYSKREMQKLQRHIFKSTKILFYTSLPVTVACILIPEYLLGIFGDEFKTATLTLTILAIGNFVNSITGSIGILLQMTGRQNKYNQIILSAAILSVILNIILIPRYGILGAAIASTTAKILQNSISVIYAKYDLGILSFYFPGIEKISFLSSIKDSK